MPRITKNLLRISKFTHDNNVIVEFLSDCRLVKDKDQGGVVAKDS